MRFRNIRIYGSLHQLDTELTRERLKRECPGFFSWKPKGERVTVHRGFVFSSHRFVPSAGTPEKKVVVYAYLPKQQDTYCICLNAGTGRRARQLVAWFLKELDTPPCLDIMMSAQPA